MIEKRKKILIIMTILSLIAAVLLLLAINSVVSYGSNNIFSMPAMALYRFRVKHPGRVLIAMAAVVCYAGTALVSKQGRTRFEQNQGNLARNAFLAVAAANLIFAMTSTYLFEVITVIWMVQIDTLSKVMFTTAVVMPAVIAATLTVSAGIIAYRIYQDRR